jgi:hypothetical protein
VGESSHGRTKVKQKTILTVGKKTFSTDHSFTERSCSTFAIRNTTFGIIGLESGFFQVMYKNGIPEIAAAVVAIKLAHLGPLIFHKMRQTMTRTDTIESMFDHEHLPLNKRMKATRVAPPPYTMGMLGSIRFLYIAIATIESSIDHKANVVNDRFSPVPRWVMTIMIL